MRKSKKTFNQDRRLHNQSLRQRETKKGRMEEETSSRKEMVPAPPAAVLNFPSFLQEAVKAILKCLGIETKFQQNPSSCTDGEVNGQFPGDDPPETDFLAAPPPRPGTSHGNCPQINQIGITDHKVNEAAVSRPQSSTTDADPPPADPQADPASSSTAEDDPPITVSLAAPPRPGTSHGSGPQIN